MGYRDDREAMRQKMGMLEGDLERTRAELERLQEELARHASKDVEDESDKERLEREVAKLRRRLGEPASGTDLARRRKWTSIGVAAAVVFVGGVVFAVNASNVDDATKPPAAASAEEPVPPKPEPEIPSTPETPAPGASGVSPPPALAASESVVFGAVVEEAQGVALDPGSGCIVHAQVSPGPSIDRLRLLCDDRVLYDSDIPLGAGMQMHSSTLIELPAGPEDELAYVLQYQDEGTRSGPRGELVADSIGQTVRVRSSGASPGSAVLRLAHFSAPRRGPALGSPPIASTGEGTRAILARATPTSREGPAPRLSSESCELEVHPSYEGGRHDCRIVLRCGASVLYGAGTTGFNDCDFDRGWPAQALDGRGALEDRDPRMSFDWPSRRITVSDDRGAESWAVTFRLGPMPGDVLEGAWDGTAWGPDGEELRISLSVPRRGPGTLRHRGEGLEGEQEVEVTLARESPEVTAGPLRGNLGPGGATVLGLFTPADGVARPFALVRRHAE